MTVHDELDDLLQSDAVSLIANQTLQSLTACYKGSTQPARLVVPGNFAARPFAWRVAAFGAAARRGIYLVDLRDALLTTNDVDPAVLPTPELKTEYVWFLFSQLAWPRIAAFIERIAPHERGALPAHVADIYFLAFYRGQVERILAGQDKAGFAGDADRVLTFLRRSWPHASGHLRAYDAIVEHILGDISAARSAFNTIADDDFIAPLAALHHVLPPEAIGAWQPGQNLSIRPAARRLTTLVSLDRGYFDQFALAAARRYCESNAANGLHLHCVGFDPATEIAAWNLPISIGVTVDNRDVGALTARQRAGYFAAARYLHLPHYLEHYDAIYIADIDGVIMRDIAALEYDLGEADVILNSKVLSAARSLTRLPWEAISAGSLFLRTSDASRLFAERVATYLEQALLRTFKQGKPFWFADQNALFYSWYDLRDRVRFTGFTRAAFSQKGSWTLFEGHEDKLDFIREKKMPPA